MGADRQELDARKREEMLTNVESTFNFVLGRRRVSRPLSAGAVKRRLTQAAEMDVLESEQTIEQLKSQLLVSTRDYNTELNTINDKWMAALNTIEEVSLVPRKSDVFSDIVAIAWVA